MFKRLLLTVTTVMIALISIRAALLPDLIPLLDSEKSGITVGSDGRIDAFCEYPTSLSATLLDCPSHTYQFGVVGGSGSICASYWVIDNTITLPGGIPMSYAFSTPGYHLICAKIYCCEGGDAIWLCTEINVPEFCSCVLPTEIKVEVLSCPEHYYQFTVPLENDLVCIGKWVVDGVSITAGDNPFLYVLTPGTHTICVQVYCCENPNQASLICVEVVVPESCECIHPNEIQVQLLDCPSHQYLFVPLGLQYICEYDWYVDGVLVSNASNLIINLTPGSHEICLKTFCCETGAGDGICITIIVPENCGCVLPDVIKVEELNCAEHLYQFLLPNVGDGVCIGKWIVDGISITDNVNPFIYNLTPGVHEICVQLYCCENPEQTFIVLCTIVDVPEFCPCVLPVAIMTTELDCPSHKYDFSLVGLSGDVCVAFWLVDGVVDGSTGYNLTLNLTPGVHEICAKVYCCDFSGGTYLCTTVIVPENCYSCVFPTGILATEINCPEHLYQFDIIGLYDAVCIKEWVIDGVGNGIDPTSLTISLTPGIHTICVNVYCCDGSSDLVQICTTVFVPDNCDCIFPEGIKVTELNCPEHLYQFSIVGPYSGMCIKDWFVDGSNINQPFDPTTYVLTPGSHDICLYIYCCETGVGQWYCVTIEVPEYCGCVFPTDINVTEISCPEHLYEFSLVGPYSGMCIKDWWVDGNNIGQPFDPTTYVLTPGPHTICVYVYCCETGQGIWLCKDIVVPVCDCILPDGIMVTPLTGCPDNKYQFGLWGGSGYCIADWYEPGVASYGNSYPLYLTLSPGTHKICVKVYCCEDPSISTELCTEVFVPYCECILPDAIMVTPLTGCPENKYQFGLWGGSGYCIADWYEPGVASYGNSYPLYLTLSPGTHKICVKVYCCEDPNISAELCTEVFVPYCECVLPDAIMVTPLTGCPDNKYQFGLWGGSGYCIADWYEPGVASYGNSYPLNIALSPGVHKICVKVYCCEDPNISIELCTEVIVPNCDCVLPDGIVVMPLTGCPDNKYEFGLWGGSGYCIAGWYEPGVASYGNSYPLYLTLSPGVHKICVKVYCCENPSISTELCIEVNVPYCDCVLPDAIMVTPLTGCPDNKYQFGLWGGSGYCISDWYEGSISYGNSYPLILALTPGTHIICVKLYCCNNPNVSTTLCTTVVVPDCPPCTFPDGIMVTALTGCPDNKYEFGLWGGSGYCISDWYEGSISYGNSYPLQIALTPGTHIICVKLYCCENSNYSINLCVTVIVPSCDCVLPDGILHEVLDCPNHKYQFTLCGGSGYCVQQWCDNGVPMGNDYPWNTTLTPGLHMICVTVYCCENPSIQTVLCKEVFVPEYCCVLPTEIGVKRLACSNKYEFTAYCVVDDNVCFGKWFVDGDAIDSGINPFTVELTPGTHEICVNVYCCDTGLGTQICVTVVVPEVYNCVLPDGIMVNVLDCPTHKYEFTLWGGIDYIVKQWYVQGTPMGEAYPFITNLAPGTYTICVVVYCCETGEAKEMCIDVTVPEFCCELPTDIGVKILDCPGHKYQFTVLCPADNICFGKWSVDGVAIDSGVNPFITGLTPGNHTICVTVYCCDYPDQSKLLCVDVYVPENCDCQFPSGIMVTELDCATHTYEFAFWDYSNICVLQWYDNGLPMGNDYPWVTTLTPGDHEICVTFYCCDNPCEIGSLCTSVHVPDFCCNLPTGIEYNLLDCVEGLYEFNLVGGSGDFCVSYWQVDDYLIASTSPFLITSLFPGPHHICAKVYCCNGTGDAQLICIDIVVEGCPCILPTEVVATQLDCATGLYQFDLIGGNDYWCVAEWVVDGSGIGSTDNPLLYNLTPGTHEICVKVYCCYGGGGSDYLCVTVEVPNCDCVYPTTIELIAKNCTEHLYTFGFVGGSDFCVAYWNVDNTGEVESGNYTPTFYLTPGWHTICAKVYCCNGNAEAALICIDFYVPEFCDCELPTDIKTTVISCPDHKYQFDLVGGDGNLCIKDWYVDGANQGAPYSPFVTTLTPGIHEVCVYVYCCDTGVGVYLCTTVVVPENCDCTYPTGIALLGSNCPEGLYTFGLNGGSNFCIAYWKIDGGAEVEGGNYSPTFYLAPGPHTICVKVYCCEGGPEAEIICIDFVVPENCECILPTKISVAALTCNTYQFGFNFGANYCVAYWTIDGGAEVEGGNYNPIFTLSGGHHTICAKVYCCDGLSDAVLICVELDVPCDIAPGGMAMAPGNSGIENQLNEKVEAKLFPVPTESILNISYDQLVNLKELTVMNMMGEIIVRKSNLGDISTTQLDVQSLSSGVYTVTLNANGHLQHISFIKK